MKTIVESLRRANQNATAILMASHLPQGLSPRQYDVLIALSEGDGVTQTELVKRTMIDRSTIVGVVERMEAKDLIKRIRTKDNARAYSVTITEKGKTMLKAARPVANRANSRILDLLPMEERDAFLAALAKLADAPLSAYIG